MKLTFSSIAIASLGFLSTSASAWSLDLFTADGRHVHTHGNLWPKCNDLSFTPALNVNHADFDPDTPILDDPSTFELYVNKGCNGLSYRNDGGNWPLTPARVIRSYRIL